MGDIFMNIDDRRVRKTKNALRQALIKLMETKELRSITIKELTDTADIHRATFYVQYQDIYDLYEQFENSVIEYIDYIMMHEVVSTYDEIYIRLINYIYDNPAICKMFLGRKSNQSFNNRVSKILERNYLKMCMNEGGTSEIPQELIFFTSYHIQGCLAIISRWVDDDFNCSKEYIIEIIKKVDMATDNLFN